MSVGPFAKTAASAFAANILNALPREGVCTEMPLTRAAIKTAALRKGNTNDSRERDGKRETKRRSGDRTGAK